MIACGNRFQSQIVQQLLRAHEGLTRQLSELLHLRDFRFHCLHASFGDTFDSSPEVGFGDAGSMDRDKHPA